MANPHFEKLAEQYAPVSDPVFIKALAEELEQDAERQQREHQHSATDFCINCRSEI